MYRVVVSDDKMPILRPFGLFFIFLKIFSRSVVILLYLVCYSRLIKEKQPLERMMIEGVKTEKHTLPKSSREKNKNKTDNQKISNQKTNKSKSKGGQDHDN